MPRVEHTEDRLGDFTTDLRVLVLSVIAVAIGATSAIIAYVLVWLIGLMTNLAYYGRFSGKWVTPAQNHLGVWAVLVPVVGGLVIGLVARYGSPKIRGHGIPEALEAILIGRSRIEPKVALLKPISSAISIGTGGPFGAEGPIIMTGAAVGSLVAQFFHLSSAERKTLLAAGAAGGMAAIFASPVAAVLLAVELLLFEWKPRSLIPVAIASVVAAAVRVPLLGAGPIFPVHAHGAMGGETLIIAFVVGILAGFASSLLTMLVYGFEDLFHKLPIHWMWWPAIGGLFVGIGGLIDPRVLGVGYDVIHSLLAGNIPGVAVLVLLLVKAFVWAIALGSGTSGGVLAPLLIMGGALGALESHFIPVGDAGLWATISMAAMMGGTMRSPFTAILFTVELTHDFNLLPGLLLGAIAGEIVTVLILPRSILTEKVARRGYHLTREYSIDPLTIIRVEEIMDTDISPISAEMKLSEYIQRKAEGDKTLGTRDGSLLVDNRGRLVGIMTRSDLLQAIQDRDEVDPATTVLDAGTRELVVAFPDEMLDAAVGKMLRNDIGRLPVMQRDDPQKVVAYLGRSDIMSARARLMEEEDLRERSWGPGRVKIATDEEEE